MADAKNTFERYIAAYAMMHNPPLDSVNPHFNNKFSSLAATLTIIHDACAQSGIAYRQTVVDEGDWLTLRTSVAGPDGEVMELSTFPLTRNTNPQQMGSQLTYAKRQAAQADWALAGDTDDDAEAAMQAPQKPAKGRQKPQEPQMPQRDFLPLKEQTERLAKLHGHTVAEEYRWIASTFGDPKAKSDEQYAVLISTLAEIKE